MDLPKTVIDNLRKLEELRGTPVLLIHSIEPLTREEAKKLDKDLRNIKKIKEISVILNSGGGDIDAAYKIINILKTKFEKITILVSNFAKSAATLITLGADEIFMSKNAELGPLDALLQHPRDPNKQISALDAFKTFEFIRDYLLESFDRAVFLMVERGLDVRDAVKNAIELVGSICRPLYSQIDPLFMGESERILLIAEEYGKRLLAEKQSPNLENLIQQIVRNYPSHSFVIDINEAKRLGLNAKLLSGEQLELVEKILEEITLEKPIVYFSSHTLEKKKEAHDEEECN